MIQASASVATPFPAAIMTLLNPKRACVALLLFVAFALHGGEALPATTGRHVPVPSCRGFHTWAGAKPCPFKTCQADGITYNLRNCAICDTIDDGTAMADMLSCNVCKEGWANVGDRYRRECLSMRSLQCRSWDGQGCEKCAPRTVQFTATRAPSIYYMASKGMCRGYWDAFPICRTCAQLGCPGACRAGAGCTACPRGSVLLQTTQPQGFADDKWKGYCTGLKPVPFEPIPRLPAVCLHAKEDLHCAPGAFKHGVGCTACPRGWKLGPVKPAFVAGSRFLQVQAAGAACHRCPMGADCA